MVFCLLNSSKRLSSFQGFLTQRTHPHIFFRWALTELPVPDYVPIAVFQRGIEPARVVLHIPVPLLHEVSRRGHSDGVWPGSRGQPYLQQESNSSGQVHRCCRLPSPGFFPHFGYDPQKGFDTFFRRLDHHFYQILFRFRSALILFFFSVDNQIFF